jgi:hypothetical protein
MSNEGYEQQFQSAALGPAWMHGPWGQRMWAAIGRVLDAQNELLRSARVVSMPDGAVAVGATDALDRMGDDRLLPRGGSAPDTADEADATYAARLKGAWTTWGQDPDEGAGAGSVLGILRQIKIAGFPIEPTAPNYLTTGGFLINHLGRIYQIIDNDLNVVGDAAACINRQNLDGTVSGTLPGWTLDARDQFYSHWSLLFVEDVPTLLNATGNAAKTRLNAICNRWKSGSAIYSGCTVVPQENTAKCWGWPGTTKWADATLTWGTNGARFIAPE